MNDYNTKITKWFSQMVAIFWVHNSIGNIFVVKACIPMSHDSRCGLCRLSFESRIAEISYETFSKHLFDKKL